MTTIVGMGEVRGAWGSGGGRGGIEGGETETVRPRELHTGGRRAGAGGPRGGKRQQWGRKRQGGGGGGRERTGGGGGERETRFSKTTKTVV